MGARYRSDPADERVGIGSGSQVTVNIYPIYFNRQPRSADGVAAFPSHEVPPPQAIKAMLH